LERKLTAILCADVYGYSRLMGEDGEATLRTLSAYRTIIDRFIANHRGRLVNSADGSVLVVWKRERLGYSLRDLKTILDDLKRREVKFRSLTEHIDADKLTGRAMWQMIGLLAELECSVISERTRAGVKAARRPRVKFRRKRKLTWELLDHARELIDRGERHRRGIANLFKVSRTTLYRTLTTHEQIEATYYSL